MTKTIKRRYNILAVCLLLSIQELTPLISLIRSVALVTKSNFGQYSFNQVKQRAGLMTLWLLQHLNQLITSCALRELKQDSITLSFSVEGDTSCIFDCRANEKYFKQIYIEAFWKHESKSKCLSRCSRKHFALFPPSSERYISGLTADLLRKDSSLLSSWVTLFVWV